MIRTTRVLLVQPSFPPSRYILPLQSVIICSKKKSSLPFNTKKKPVAPSWNSFLHLSFYFHQEKSCGERKTRGADAVRQMGVSTSPRAAAAVVDSLVCNFLIKRSRAASTRIATLEWASLSLSLSRLFTLQRLDAERLRYCPSVAPAATFGTLFN